MLALVLALAAASAAQTDMLAQFRAGQWLCSNPDEATRTCSTIDRVYERPDGTLIETGETLIAPDQPMTLEMTSLVQIKASTECASLDLADVEKTIVRYKGEALPPDRNAKVVAKIVTAYQPLAGKTLCEELRVENGQLIKAAHIEHMDMALPTKPVRWIGAADGYRVAPPSS